MFMLNNLMRIYKDAEFENAKSEDIALKHIDKRIEPYKKDFVRTVTRDDLRKLLDIRMAYSDRKSVV